MRIFTFNPIQPSSCDKRSHHTEPEAWWHCGNTFASHCYDLGSILTFGPHVGCLSSISMPMLGGFPLGVFFHPQKGLKLFRLEPSHKAYLPLPELVLGDVKSMALLTVAIDEFNTFSIQ